MNRRSLVVLLGLFVALSGTQGSLASSQHTCSRTVAGVSWKITPGHSSCSRAASILRRFAAGKTEPSGWLCQGDGINVPLTCNSRHKTEFSAKQSADRQSARVAGPRSCASVNETRQSKAGPFADGSTAENIEAYGGVSCSVARSKIRRCVFHKHVKGWVAVAAVDTSDLPQDQILPTINADPQMAPLVHGHPSLSRYVTFTIAGGQPECFASGVAENVD